MPPERQAELEAAYHKNVAQGKAPYQDVAIRTRSELQWVLIARKWSGELIPGSQKRADLSGARLRDSRPRDPREQGINLSGMHLRGATLTGTDLWRVDLSGADLSGADLSGATLTGATLVGTNLNRAVLSGANLGNANLSGTVLIDVNLAGAYLRECRLDVATLLEKATLDSNTQLADVVWNNAPLTRVAWDSVPKLGDELQAHEREYHQYGWAVFQRSGYKDSATRIEDYEAAARAYRQLAVALRSQGLNEQADHYAYRAQVCQRVVFRRQHKYGAWLFAWLLAVLAGYGFRLERIFITYVLAVSAFALVYLAVGVPGGFPHGTVPLLDAFQVSVTAIHGRVFFEQLKVGSAVAWIAAGESIVGIVIEGVFVAMLVQRFFGGR